MSGRLEADDLRAVRSITTLLLSPLDRDDVAVWCRDVANRLRDLLGADMVALVQPREEGLHMEGGHYGKSALEYPFRVRELEREIPLLRCIVDAGVYHRASLLGHYLEHYRDTSFWHDYIVPNRCFDSIGFGVQLRPGLDVANVAQVLAHHERLDGRQFGEREHLLLQMLAPAFTAGATASLRLSSARTALARTLDALNEALLVCDDRGRLLHVNRALVELLRTDPEGDRVRKEMEIRAASLAQALRERLRSMADPTCLIAPIADTTTSTRSYRMRGAYTGDGTFGPGPTVIMALDPLGMEWPDRATLQTRFRLTRAQARVALLLARGCSNAEIASELGISPATARNHSARVREKLGVSSRSRIASAILDGTDTLD